VCVRGYVDMDGYGYAWVCGCARVQRCDGLSGSRLLAGCGGTTTWEVLRKSCLSLSCCPCLSCLSWLSAQIQVQVPPWRLRSFAPGPGSQALPQQAAASWTEPSAAAESTHSAVPAKGKVKKVSGVRCQRLIVAQTGAETGGQG